MLVVKCSVKPFDTFLVAPCTSRKNVSDIDRIIEKERLWLSPRSCGAGPRLFCSGNCSNHVTRTEAAATQIHVLSANQWPVGRIATKHRPMLRIWTNHRSAWRIWTNQGPGFTANNPAPGRLSGSHQLTHPLALQQGRAGTFWLRKMPEIIKPGGLSYEVVLEDAKVNSKLSQLLSQKNDFRRQSSQSSSARPRPLHQSRT